MEKVTKCGWPLLLLAQAYPKKVPQVDDEGPPTSEDRVTDEEENVEVVVNHGNTKPMGEVDKENVVPVSAEWNNMNFTNLAVSEGY